MNAVFLSASVPVPGRGRFYETADVMLIRSAIRCLMSLVLGRRLLVWGGHPAITPMMWAAAQDLGVFYGEWVHLFQSKFFQEDFPEENARFRNVTLVDSVPGNREASLRAMRREMLSRYAIYAGVFVGGMEGCFEELSILRELQPAARIVPIASAGGAAAEVFERVQSLPLEYRGSIDYLGMLSDALDVSVDERRHRSPRRLVGVRSEITFQSPKQKRQTKAKRPKPETDVVARISPSTRAKRKSRPKKKSHLAPSKRSMGRRLGARRVMRKKR